MLASKRKCREAKSAEEEEKVFDNAISGSTRFVTKWVIEIFLEWQAARGNKNCLDGQVGFKFDMNMHGTRFEHWCCSVNYLGSKLFNAGQIILQVKSDWNNEIDLTG